MVGVHGAVQSQGWFAGLVNIGDGLDEGSILLMSEAMVVDYIIKPVGPPLSGKMRFALGLVHLKKDIPLGLDALADSLADDVFLVLVIMAATTGYHEGLERLLAMMVGKGGKRGYQNESK